MSNSDPNSDSSIMTVPTAKFILFLASGLFGFIMARVVSCYYPGLHVLVYWVVGIFMSIFYPFCASIAVIWSECLIKGAFRKAKHWPMGNRVLAGAIWPATLLI